MQKYLGRYWLAFEAVAGGAAFAALFTSDLGASTKVFVAFALILVAGLLELHALEAANARDIYRNETIAALQALEQQIAGKDVGNISDSITHYHKRRTLDDVAAGSGGPAVISHAVKFAVWPVLGWVVATWLWPFFSR